MGALRVEASRQLEDRRKSWSARFANLRPGSPPRPQKNITNPRHIAAQRTAEEQQNQQKQIFCAPALYATFGMSILMSMPDLSGAAAQAQDEMQRGLLLDVVVR